MKVATGSADEEGRLAFHDGRLIAVLVRLDDADHGAERGQWSLEAGFDGVDSAAPPLFPTLAEAGSWIEAQIGGAAPR